MPDRPVKFSRRLFEPHEGSTFELVSDDGNDVPVVLDEVSDKTPSGFEGEQFSLVFRGPHEPELDQRIYTLNHESLGSIELFLVPIGAPKRGRLYEAYFNLTSRSEA